MPFMMIMMRASSVSRIRVRIGAAMPAATAEIATALDQGVMVSVSSSVP